MKRIMFILLTFAILAIGSAEASAMSSSRVRKEARFLTDKMAYELGLSNRQYDDVYEINYDFIYSIRYVVDDIVRGYDWAINDYYNSLDIRNDDLRWVLSNNQYRQFMRMDYFYRPIYVSGGRWNFRVYINYTNVNHFYYPKPYHYRSYSGGNYRNNYSRPSYYSGRHNHPHYNNNVSIRNDKVYHSNRRSDFGSVNVRPNSSQRPTNNNSNSKPNNNNASTRPSNNNNSSSTSRPSNNNNSSSTSRPSNNNNNSSSTSRPSNNNNNNSSSTSRPSNNNSSNSSTTRPSNSNNNSNSSSSRPSSGSSNKSSNTNNSSSSTSRRSSSGSSTSGSSSSKSSTRSSSSSDSKKSESKSSSSRSSKTSNSDSNSSSRR